MDKAGPRVVAVGGGHGLAASLRAIRTYAGEVTAVVSVADDGGSSGRLRNELGMAAPGDLRKCLVALGDANSVWTQSLEHRFDSGDLEGHPLGNLVIAGLTAATGDFVAAIQEVERLVGSIGRVLPATLTPVVLHAEVDGASVQGQVNIAHAGHVTSVSLLPADAMSPPEVTKALAEADQIVIGPGSLFTSVLAAAIVPDVKAALATTPAQRVYVCNLQSLEPETQGFDVAAHVKALEAHGVHADVVLYDSATMELGELDSPVIDRRLARPNGLAHDAELLAKALAELSGRL